MTCPCILWLVALVSFFVVSGNIIKFHNLFLIRHTRVDCAVYFKTYSFFLVIFLPFTRDDASHFVVSELSALELYMPIMPPPPRDQNWNGQFQFNVAR